MENYSSTRLATIRANRDKPRANYLSDRGRLIHGPTPPGGSAPADRESDLTAAELAEVIELIASGRKTRTPVVMPERLRARSWDSMAQVVLKLEYALGWEGAGWKVGAASLDVRKAENIPEPSPGRLFTRSVMNSPAEVPSEFFVNYRLCESEFAFQFGVDFPVRENPYTEADVRAGVEHLAPVIEIGDSVFEDWYSLSGYFGGMYDNAGGAAFVIGDKFKNWQDIDLPNASLDLYVNDSYIKSGQGFQAMGHPITSATWMINWLRERGRYVKAGEYISTGTCTGHCFVQVGDLVSVDFGELGLVEAKFV